MRGTAIVPLLLGCALLAGLPQVTEAKVVRFVVQQRAPFAEGATFGETGAYERLTGTAYFEVNPNDPLNAVIVDLDPGRPAQAPGDRPAGLPRRLGDRVLAAVRFA